MIYNRILPKRRHKRYDVSWKALIEIDSPDFNDFLSVPILNMSRSGALLFAPEMYIHNYHLSVAAQNDELNLIIHSPMNELDSRIRIRHFNWEEERGGYHVGVEFRDICDRNQDFIDEMIRGVKQISLAENPYPDYQLEFSVFR